MGYLVIIRQQTPRSDDSGRRARRKCDGTGARCGCALPSEPEGIAAAIDAAITGPMDKDRACMKALLIPEARMMFVFTRHGRSDNL